MDRIFFELPNEEQAEYIHQTADKLDMLDIIIEKDLWLCWILEKIFSLPIQMAFKGGTSLSKVFGLIKRFSEDADVTIDYRNFENNLFFENMTRSQLKKTSEKLKIQLKLYIETTLLLHLFSESKKIFDISKFEITLSEDGEQLRFYYPSVINSQSLYLRDHVFIEFGIRNSIEPCEK